MRTKRSFVLYGVVLVLAISTLANLINSLVATPGTANNLSVAITLTILISLCLFLALFNYEPTKSPRQIELALLRKLEESWIQSLLDLERSLPGALTRNFHMEWVGKNRGDIKDAIETAFRTSGDSLLIVGEPAAGKTVSLLRLARVLLKEAKEEANRGIPIVLNLSSLGQDPLETWLVRELNTRYDLAEEVSSSWLLQRRFILLLDGLEEVSACAPCVKEKKACACCVKTIDEFLARKLVNGIAIATTDKSALPALDGRVRVQMQLDAEFDRLLLPKISSEYRNYILNQIDNAERVGAAFPNLKVLAWLHWLAQASKHKRQSYFTTAQVQPSWLSQRWLKASYLIVSRIAGAATVMVIGYLVQLFSTKLLMWVSNGSQNRIPSLFNIQENKEWWLITTIVAGGLVTAALDGIHLWLAKGFSLVSGRGRQWCLRFASLVFQIGVYWAVFYFVASRRIESPKASLGAVVFAVSFGLVFWFRGQSRTLANDTHTADKLVWSRAHIPLGVLYGFLGGIISGGLLALAEPHSVDRFSKLHVVGLLILIAVFIGPIAGGLKKVSIVEQTSTNQNLRTALRSTILIWLSVGTPSVLLIWGYAVVVMSPERALGAGMFYGLVAGLLCGFAYSGFDLVYRVVFRLFLVRKAPLLEWNKFLDYSVSLGFLRKIGGGYMFFHTGLRDYFANRDEFIELERMVAKSRLLPNATEGQPEQST